MHFQTLVHMLYQILYLFLDPCVHMEVYFEAIRFVSMLLDLAKIKCIQWGFNKGHARRHVILGFNEQCTP